MTELGPSPLTRGDELPVAAARAAIAAALRPIRGTQQVPLAQATGRVLAQDLRSPIAVPAHDNSAMDGYAFAGSQLQTETGTRLHALPGTAFAGQPLAQRIGPGQCIRIMTGAVMPDGTDTVVPIELCQVDAGQVLIGAGVLRAGENRRRRGEDLAQGGVALSAGRVLRPADVGLLASLGLAEVQVMRQLRVALFSTGDELLQPGQPPTPGCIYDSNRFSLQAALQRLGLEVLDLGAVPDDPAALRQTLDRAVTECDAVITSGGVSMGDADYTRDLLAEMGTVSFWKVAMRPGRPFAFGPLRRPVAAADAAGGDSATPFLFALPGNPVAALVTFYAFAREALMVLVGARPLPLPVLRARSVGAIRKRPGRTEFQRAIVEPGADGQWQVRLTGSQGAGVLRSMSEANALLVLGHEQGSVAAGEMVEVWLFDGLV